LNICKTQPNHRTELPLFSLITPLYNKGEYFQETVDSVLGQSCADWEWMIVDDGSTDGSLEMARQGAAGDERIQVFTQSNSGPCTARNRGVEEARGEWLLFLDADDVLESDCLEGWVAAIIKASYATLHAGTWHEMTPDGRELTCTRRPSGHDADDPTAVLRDSAIAYAPWHPAAAIVQRDAVGGDCLWDESMNRMVTEDTVFWWRLIARCAVALHEHCGVRYRRGTPGCRDQFRNPVRWSEGLFHALESNVDFWTNAERILTAGQVANLVRVYETFGRVAEGAGSVAIAAEAFRRADALLATGYWSGPGGRLRRFLGTRRFGQWRSMLKPCGGDR
jgi:glycosyltransferase involved in cell wall biosynthesis